MGTSRVVRAAVFERCLGHLSILLTSLVPRPFPYLTACARGKEGSGKMLGLSAGPGILSAYRKRNIQVAVKPQCTYIQQLH